MSVKTAVLDHALDSVITEEFAKHLVGLRADAETQAKVSLLGHKCSEGTLTPSEKEEYEAHVAAFQLVSLLQAKAHRVLKQASKSA